MAKRRMFSQDVTESDWFTSMSAGAQSLYFHLGMIADDEGFVSEVRKAIFESNASQDDYRVLIAKKFILERQEGVIVIKHWNINNYIQKDRFTPTLFPESKEGLYLKPDGSYTLDPSKGRPLIAKGDKGNGLDTECIQNGYKMDTDCTQNGYKMYTQVSVVKDSLGKDNKTDACACVRPTLDDVREEVMRNGYAVDYSRFYGLMESQGWKDSEGKEIRNWRALLRSWAKESQGQSSEDWFSEYWRKIAEGMTKGRQIRDEDWERK